MQYQKWIANHHIHLYTGMKNMLCISMIVAHIVAHFFNNVKEVSFEVAMRNIYGLKMLRKHYTKNMKQITCI